MSATLTCEPGHVWTLRIQGLLAKADMEQSEDRFTPDIDAGEKIKAMVILDDFEGWKPDDNWDDISFFAHHGSDIAKIAVVGDPKWEAQVLLFVGAGIRSTEVRYFPTEQEADAWAWLME